MARWKLATAHYLNVKEHFGQTVEWEYTEQPRNGRPIRKRFQVPLYLDPRDPSDFNYPEAEMIVVTNKAHPAYPKDIVFEGEPTPDMIPLDDEAEAINAELEPKWSHPIDGLPANGGDYSQSLIAAFETSISNLLKANPDAGKPVPNVGGVSKEEFEKLQSQVQALMARNAELEANAASERRA